MKTRTKERAALILLIANFLYASIMAVLTALHLIVEPVAAFGVANLIAMWLYVILSAGALALVRSSDFLP